MKRKFKSDNFRGDNMYPIKPTKEEIEKFGKELPKLKEKKEFC